MSSSSESVLDHIADYLTFISDAQSFWFTLNTSYDHGCHLASQFRLEPNNYEVLLERSGGSGSSAVVGSLAAAAAAWRRQQLGGSAAAAVAAAARWQRRKLGRGGQLGSGGGSLAAG